jgi:uncharacterized protein (TIGR03435 family)
LRRKLAMPDSPIKNTAKIETMNRPRPYTLRVVFPLAVACFAAASSLARAQAITLPGDSQKAAATLPRFDVATIKPGKTQKPFIVGYENNPGGRIVVTNFTLTNLIMIAFDVKPYQIVGGPGWMNSDRFVIEAKPPESSASAASNPADSRMPLSDEQRQMLVALLIDRFQLRYHLASKQGPVYLLERGSGKLALQPPKVPNSHPWAGVQQHMTGIQGGNISMPELAKRLSDFLERPVIDRTGITGSHDFEFTLGESDPNGPATQEDFTALLITAIHGLGLKITDAKGPVESVVIDSAEQPSPN